MNNTPAVTTTDHMGLSDQMKFAEVVTSGGRAQSILPDSYRENPANVLIAVGLGQAMGLSPAESLYRISVIKGKPAAGAELIAANVRKAGHKLRVRGDEQSCTATIIRADDPDYEFAVTRDMAWAQRMGLASNDNYKKQPGTMLQWRAITAAARLACPEALYGVTYTPDEVMDGTGPADAPRAQQATAADFIEQPSEPVEYVQAEPDTITSGQQKKMGALMREVGITQREHALAYVNDTIGREVASRSELTKAEAGQVIDALEADQQRDTQPAPDDADTDPGAPWGTEGGEGA